MAPDWAIFWPKLSYVHRSECPFLLLYEMIFFLNSMIINQISCILFYKSHTFGFEFCLFYISFWLDGRKAIKEKLFVQETMVAFIFSNFTRENNLMSFTCKHLCLGQLFEGGLRWHFIWGEISQAYIQLNFQSYSAVDDMTIDRTKIATISIIAGQVFEIFRGRFEIVSMDSCCMCIHTYNIHILSVSICYAICKIQVLLQ